MRAITRISWACCIALVAAAAVADEKPVVRFEVATEKGLGGSGANDWFKTLTSAGVSDLQIRAAAAGDQAGIDQRSLRGTTVYNVKGVITSRGVLQLPGANFTVRDSAGIKNWLAKLSELGPEGVTQPLGAFGFTPSQLKLVQSDLKRRVDFKTKQTDARQTLAAIGRALESPLHLEPGADKALADVTVEDELRGLSSGTALAALLRPAGLVLVPERVQGKQLRYRVAQPTEKGDFWPVGWSPRQSPAKVLPGMFEQIDVEISDTPVSEAVAAIAERLHVPLLYDHNALAERNVDPAKLNANVPAKRMSYNLALDKVLAPVKLRAELRVDEADRPLLWVSGR